MALKLTGADDTTIIKLGRWSGLTFLQYIHNQIAHLSANLWGDQCPSAPHADQANALPDSARSRANNVSVLRMQGIRT